MAEPHHPATAEAFMAEGVANSQVRAMLCDSRIAHLLSASSWNTFLLNAVEGSP